MDSIVYWISIAVRILLVVFLLRAVIWAVFWVVERVWGVVLMASGWRLGGVEAINMKTRNLEVQISNIFVAMRWFDPTCRHFFKVNIGGVHVEYFLAAGGGTRSSERKRPPSAGPSRKTRFFYWWIRKITKWLELWVKCLEVWVHEMSESSRSSSLITVLQVSGHLSVIAQPQPNRVLAVSVEVEKAGGQLLLHAERPTPTSEDAFFPLLELSFSSKLFLFLDPLAPDGKSTLHSLQVNTLPLSLSLLQEGYVLKHLQSLLPATEQTTGGGASPSEPLQRFLSQLPEKSEIVLEDVQLHYHANKANRRVSSKVTRVSATANLTPAGEEERFPAVSLAVGLQGLSVMDSRSRKSLKLHQLRLLSKFSSRTFSNTVHIESAHAALWEGEAMFWIRYIQDSINSYQAKPMSDPRQDGEKRTSARQRTSSFLNVIGNSPVSVVTTIEASDWSVLLRMDSPTLQSKEPVCRAVMASGVANLQWSEVKEDSTTIRASLRLEDSYLHVPGFLPDTNAPSHTTQRTDNPTILPSLRKHLWGRALSLGSFTLKGERDVALVGGPPGAREVKFSKDPVRICGEGCSLMMEWSKPTVVTLTRVLKHLRKEYKLCDIVSRSATSNSGIRTTGTDPKQEKQKSQTQSTEAPESHSQTESTVSGLFSQLLPLDIKLQVTDLNVFIYGLTPAPPAAMLRLDAASLTSSSPPSLGVELHGLLVESLILPHIHDRAFLCSSIANLPEGVGVAHATSLGVKYNHEIKDVSMGVVKLTVNWNTTAHRSLYHVFSCLWKDTKELKGSVSPVPSASPPSPPAEEASRDGVISLGEVWCAALDKVPLCFNLSLEMAKWIAQLDRKTKVSLSLQTGHCSVKQGSLAMDVYEVGVHMGYEEHQLLTLERVVVEFPHCSEELLEERREEERIQREQNPAVALSALKAVIVFPYLYRFGDTLNKILSVKRYLQNFHGGTGSGSKGSSPSSLPLLPPDIVVECEEILLQLCDDPFEIKLRTSYELLCDEHEQQLQRREEVKRKLKALKKERGEILSATKVQSLYDSLEVKDSEIYCRRAKEMHTSSSQPSKSGLFMYSMEGTRLHMMFDPSIVGRENLVAHLKDVDSISPFPESQKFSTLWGFYASGNTQKFQFQLRDYPLPLLMGTEVEATGRLLFAEQEPQEREKRFTVVEVGHPWKNESVERNMQPLKYYYDLDMNAVTLEWTNGPCFEPTLAQSSRGMDLLTSPTVDPSKSLPYWDKLRLLFHGRLQLAMEVMKIIIPGTTKPYNNVEFLEVRLGNLDAKLLTNTKLDLQGSLQLFVHTASKYDECEILSFPRVCSSLSLSWYCGGRDPNNHHAVIRCAPDKLPIQPDKQEHDSYNAFRSHYLDLKWTIDVQPPKADQEDPDVPSILLYSSTLRLLQQYQVLLARSVTRPIRRGIYFKSTKPRRPPLTRHWRLELIAMSTPQYEEQSNEELNLSISASFPKSVLFYRSSVATQRGLECNVDHANFSISYTLTQVPFEDGLRRRPRLNWNICSCQGCLDDLTAHVHRSAKQTQFADEEDREGLEEELGEELEGEGGVRDNRCIVLSMGQLTYTRQEETSNTHTTGDDEYMHRLQTHNTRLLWNASNREVVMGLWDAYKRAQMLKRDLSTEALKFIAFRLDTPVKDSVLQADSQDGEEGDIASGEDSISHFRMKRHGSSGCTMLDQLLRDTSKVVAHAEERARSDPALKGIEAISSKDILQQNWFIELNNTQIALQGIEHKGYVVASSYMTQVLGCEHEPRLREGDLVTKKSWNARALDLQYFSTFGPNPEPDCIPWLPLSVICPPPVGVHDPNSPQATPQDQESSLNALLSELGPERAKKQDFREAPPPGEAVGGLVSCFLVPGADDSGGQNLSELSRQRLQLQRIASRCHCTIIYVTYGEQVEADDVRKTPPLLSPAGHTSPGLDSSSEAVDTFTFRYPNFEVSTTSSQYSLFMDIVNNLLLHKKPGKKEALDRHAHMQFTLQLSDIQDPRKPVLVQQNKVRNCLQSVRQLETELFREQKAVGESGFEVLKDLEIQLSAAKEELSTASMKLRAMIRAFKESQLYVTPPRGTYTEAAEPVRQIEVWLDDAHWLLTQDDGQLQMADIRFTNFSYNWVSYSDDSGEHRFELGTFKVRNLMPNTPQQYQDVLNPYDPRSRHLRVDRNINLRVFCRDKAPVAGIPVKEHLEFNVIPLAVTLTSHFQQTLQDFFFPKAEGEGQQDTAPPETDHAHVFGGVQPTISTGDVPDGGMASRQPSMRSTLSIASATSTGTSVTAGEGSSPPTSPNPKEVRKRKPRQADDVEKMKERASHIKTFIYVKIPQTSLRITYKSENVSLKDLNNVLVTMPTLEYHNKNWSWTDMLMEVKRDYKNAIVHQTLKSAIGMNESEEAAGLASPKLTRHVDLLMGKTKSSIAGKGRKLFGKLSGSSEGERGDPKKGPSAYQPPLMDPEINLKREYKQLTKMSQDAQK